MKSRTETVFEGEWFTQGTVDDWLAAHAKSKARALTEAQIHMLRMITTPLPEGQFWLIRESEYWHRLEVVGLYDGWVFWQERIVVGTDGPLPGLHNHEAYDLTGIAVGVPSDRNTFPYKGWKIDRVVEVPR